MKTPGSMNAEDRALLETIETRSARPGSLERGRARLASALEGRGRGWAGPSLVTTLLAGAAAAWAIFVGSPSAERLGAGATRVVEAGEPAGRWAIGPRSIIELAGPGRLEVRRLTPAGAAVVALSPGFSRHRVEARPGEPYVVEVGAWSVEVLGTVFSLRAEADTLELELTEGAVRVRGPGVDARYTAPAFERISAVRAADGAWQGPSTARGRAEGHVWAAVPASLVRPKNRARKTAPKTAGSSKGRGAERKALSGERPRTLPIEAPSDRSDRSRPAQARSDPLRPEPPTAEASPSAKAIEVAVEVRSAGPTLADVEALVARRAFLEARRALADYLSLAEEDARTDMAGLRIAVGLEDEAGLDAIAQRLKRRRHDPRLETEVIYWQAELARRRRDFRAAEPRFEAVIRRGGARVEDALWSLGWCLTQQEAFERAAKILERYLEHYPRGRYASRARAWLEENRD